jgi:hypothetical protein
MGLQTNLDKKLSPSQIAAAERSERRKAFIQEQTKKAEAEERSGTQQPDTVFAWQRQDAVTTNPLLDKDPSLIRGVKMLPVKQQVVMPDGTFAVDIGGPGDAAYEAARLGVFCVNCRNKQPDSQGEWDEKMRRLERCVLGPRPAHAVHGSHCCYCGCELGLKGDAAPASVSGLTPEQTELMERMAGPGWMKGK